MKNQLFTIFKFPFLRNILIAFLAIAVIIPLYEHFRAFPLFRDLLTKAAEDQVIRIATHLSSYDFFSESTLDSTQSIPKKWIEEVSMVSKDLKLEKVKIFSNVGKVIFSTDSKEIGTINTHDYFQNHIATGQVFTKVVEKDTKSQEGRVLYQTVVETYVPIMRNNVFMGSFEIYYDIADQKKAMNLLLGRLNLDMIFMGIWLSLLAVALVLRAAKEMKEREKIQEALRLSEETFRSVTDCAKDAIVMIDTQGRINLWNGAAESMFGYVGSEILGKNMHKTLAPERFYHVANKGFSAFSETGHGSKVVGNTVEMMALHKNGHEFPVEVSVSAIHFRGTWHAIGILRDISTRKEVEQKLKLGFRVMENAADGILVTNGRGIIEMVNPAFTQVTGFSPEEVIGQNPNILKSGRHHDDFYRDMWQSLLDDGIWRGEIWNRRKDGAIYPQQLSMSAIIDTDGNTSHYVAVFNDITQRKADEANLERLAFYDPLTGAPNRLLFLERLDQTIKENRRHKTASALLFLDLDHFKQVNDTHGHEIGDLLLQEATQRLQALVREEDTVSRLGGDEFTLILPHASTHQDAERVAGEIIESMTKPFHFNGIECHIGASIGIAFHPFHADDMDTLIKRADMAMYVAKKGGRNRFHIHESVEQGKDIQP